MSHEENTHDHKHMHFDTIEKARSYNENGNIKETGAALGEKVNEIGPVTKDTVILDFGCGTGLVGLSLLKYAKKVVFLDPNPSMLQVLQEMLDTMEEKNYEIVNGTIEKYTGEPVDIIIASLVLHHVPELEQNMKVIASHLKQGGRIFVGDFIKTPPFPGFEEGQLEAILDAAGFENFVRQDWFVLDINNFEGQNAKVPRFLLYANKK